MNPIEIGKILSEYISGVIVLNNNKEIIWANNYIKKISGKNDILNRKLFDIFHWNIDELVDQEIRDVSDKKYEMKVRKISTEDTFFLYIFIEEITAFTNKETKLFCLEQIIETINDGVIVSDNEGRVVLYNKSQEALEDLSSSEVVGKYLWEAYSYDAKEMSEHRKVYKTKMPVVNKYKAHAFNEGMPKYVSYSTYPIVKNGNTIAVFSISKNETKLKTLLSETIELKRRLYTKGTEKESVENTNGTSYTFSYIVGDSEATKSLIREAQAVAMLDSNILIVGETGTGKEVLAQSIHNFSKKQKEPFVAINCGAIPENLLESTLFGTEKGSYTGAVNKIGLFEEAQNGTLFLDEMNSMPISMQTKLLRVLQEKKVRRVGGLNTIDVNCRVISAVNEDPQELIRSGRLRQDLFYRITGFCLYILPLRERKEDILSIAKFFIKVYNRILNKKIKTLSKELVETLYRYRWPGNVRQLEHVIENLMVRAGENKEELTLNDIPSYLKKDILEVSTNETFYEEELPLPQTLRNLEKKLILKSLEKNKWNISETARDLGIIRQSLIYRLKKLGVEKTE